MVNQRVYRSTSSCLPRQGNSSRFTKDPFATKAQQELDNSNPTPTRRDIENGAFQQAKFEAFGLQLKGKSGTITPMEQDRLTSLQAKMDDFWTQRSGRSSKTGETLQTLQRSELESSISPTESPGKPRNLIQRKIKFLDTGASSDAKEAAALIKNMGENEEHWDDDYENILVALDAAKYKFDDQAKLLEYLESYEDSGKKYFEIKIRGARIYFGDADDYVEEEENVREILREMAEDFGIRISNRESLKALRFENEEVLKTYGPKRKAEASRVRAKVDKVKSESIEVSVLNGIYDALQRFASILGPNRKKSSRKGAEQEITTIGVLSNDPSGPGEGLTSQKYKNIHLYQHAITGANDSYDFTVKTMVHELTHGLLEHKINDFVNDVTWWKTVDRRLSSMEILEILKRGGKVEFPVNDYASGKSNEDLAETSRLYLYSTSHHNTLKTDYPEHYAAIQKIVQDVMGLDEKAVEIMLNEFEEDVGGDKEIQIQKFDILEFAKSNLKEDQERETRLQRLGAMRSNALIKAQKKEREARRLQGLKGLTRNQGKRLALFTRQAKNARARVSELESEIRAVIEDD